MIESRKGPLKFTALVLASAVASNLVEYGWDGPLAGGFSGVIYALFGYAWMKGRFEPWEGIAVSKGTTVILLMWLVYCMTGWAGPIGNAAHASGLATGALIGWLPSRLRRRPPG
jgi:GlpG protein